MNHPASSQFPYLSVIVPTYNRLEQLKLVLASLEKQTFPLGQFEVLVVSDGSTDGTNEYLQTLQTPLNLTPLFQENQGVAATRNHGIQRAQGKIILFLDDDVVPIPEFIAEHLTAHEKVGENYVVIGPMLTPPDFRPFPWVMWSHEQLREQYEAMNAGVFPATARQFYTGNTSLAKQILDTYGTFDPQFRRAEDVELAYRLENHGVCFSYCHRAIGYHYEERSFNSWLAIPYAYGRNDVIFTYEKGHTWLLPTLLREFNDRHLFTRTIVRLCLDRPVLSKWVTRGMKSLIDLGYKINLLILPRLACSALFNLYHYQGIADELGGRHFFFAGVAEKSVALSSRNGS
jgi:glycosyltransferase involved in cell wall biosynthesis